MDRGLAIPEKSNPICFPVLVPLKRMKSSVFIHPKAKTVLKTPTSTHTTHTHTHTHAHAHTRTHTLVFGSDSWVWQGTYISSEIKLFENLRVDLVFLESSVLRFLRAVVKILAGGRVKLLLIISINGDSGNPVQQAISRK